MMQAAHRFYVGDKLTLTKSFDGFPVGSEAEVKSIDVTSVQLVFKLGVMGTYSAALIQAHCSLPYGFHQRIPHAITDTRRPEAVVRGANMEVPHMRKTAL